VWGGSKPQRDPGRLHGLVDHHQQLGGQGVQIDLLAQMVAERRDPLGSVVAAPVERRSTACWMRRRASVAGLRPRTVTDDEPPKASAVVQRVVKCQTSSATGH
jgi:hypothetical protein